MMAGYVRAPEPAGILLLHASAVRVDGQALLFLGPSGAGKSTICSLLSGFARPLADDLVYLFSREAGWTVADGKPRALEGPLSADEAAVLQGTPLRALFRLCQDFPPRLEPLPALEVCRYLVGAFLELFWQCHWSPAAQRAAFAQLAALARAVPGYRLYFDPSPRTVAVVREELGLPES
jgi:energy-coupling factor transporter ATP-binding protein EcfA2